MFPQNPESWIFLLVAGCGGFLIGQWIKKRRNRSSPTGGTLYRKERGAGKHLSKKLRRKGNRLRKARLAEEDGNEA